MANLLPVVGALQANNLQFLTAQSDSEYFHSILVGQGHHNNDTSMERV